MCAKVTFKSGFSNLFANTLTMTSTKDLSGVESSLHFDQGCKNLFILPFIYHHSTDDSIFILATPFYRQFYSHSTTILLTIALT